MKSGARSVRGTATTVVGITNTLDELEKIVSSTVAVDLFLLQKLAVFAQEKWLHSLNMGDTHSEVTIMPLEDFDFLQHQFLLTRKVMLVSYC